MARDDPHFRLRIPIDLKAKVEAAAEESGRSINAEILFRLSNTFGDNELFNAAHEMYKTMNVQAEALNEQQKALEMQAETIQKLHDKIMEIEPKAEAYQTLSDKGDEAGLKQAVEKLSAEVNGMSRSMALFGFAIDEAARGDPDMLNRLIESARKNPLPESSRREAAERADPLLPKKK